ncbi:HAD-IIA family hydrolase [Arcanobacterium haemolyticum]|nr:HAD-IIA family hydrolase [Arcanobacterium haemolyticum]
MSQSFVSHFDVGLFDLDGVCYLGPNPVIYAPENITTAVEAGMRQAYVTNNASRTPEAMAEQLSSLGIPASGENVISSGQVGARMLAQRVPAGSKVLVVGTEALRADVRKEGLVVVDSVDDEPVAVIQGFTPKVDWELMSEAALAIRAGALYLATNLDATIPRDRGLMIGNGSIAAAITNSTGVKPLSAGKPEPEIFKIAARMMDAERPFAVGDNLDTDIQGAVAAEIPVLHVLTGLATARDVCIARPEQRPTYLADDLRCLNEPYPEVESDGDWIVVGEHRARWSADSLEAESRGSRVDVTDGSVIALNLYRAIAHSTWSYVDSGASSGDVEGLLADFSVSRDV